eukprot:Blabericola_migrator_1__4284@NODE_2313_length_2950_cov_612_657995_g1449_i0_p3_GENE_NODE_2313_length_2950_cov_612_657995_g1449_i0NODE_2313_length_2950_cov_612_657995_g1449_i0_p3_ORF_typecomplete_len129_score16_00_NODE_2313_length_2950_cov_612_657995_g1449_i0222608
MFSSLRLSMQIVVPDLLVSEYFGQSVINKVNKHLTQAKFRTLYKHLMLSRTHQECEEQVQVQKQTSQTMCVTDVCVTSFSKERVWHPPQIFQKVMYKQDNLVAQKLVIYKKRSYRHSFNASIHTKAQL